MNKLFIYTASFFFLPYLRGQLSSLTPLNLAKDPRSLILRVSLQMAI